MSTGANVSLVVSLSLVKVKPNLSANCFTISVFKLGCLSVDCPIVCWTLVSGYRYRGKILVISLVLFETKQLSIILLEIDIEKN